MHAHPDRPHQSGGRDADAAEAENAADLAGQRTIARVLVELAAFQRLVFHQQPFRGGQGHCQRVFGHRFGVGAAVAGDRDVGGQVVQRDEIDPCVHELNQAGGHDLGGFGGVEFAGGVAGQ